MKIKLIFFLFLDEPKSIIYFTYRKRLQVPKSLYILVIAKIYRNPTDSQNHVINK